MNGFILLEDAAKRIDAAEGRASYLPGGISYFSRDVGREVFGNIHESLLRGALDFELAVFNPLTAEQILPGDSDKRLWTTFKALNDWLLSNGTSFQFPTMVSNAQAKNRTGAGIGNKKPRIRRDNLGRAIEAAVEAIGRKPTLDELWQYFQNDKDTTGFIADYTDIHITWTCTKGKLHDTQKKSIANRLSRIKS